MNIYKNILSIICIFLFTQYTLATNDRDMINQDNQINSTDNEISNEEGIHIANNSNNLNPERNIDNKANNIYDKAKIDEHKSRNKANHKNNAKKSIYTTALPGSVALTFDDGPHPIYTKQILNILSKYNIKATFFVVGKNVEKYPDILKMIYEHGHAINSHSYTHPILTKVKNIHELDIEINKTSDIIEKVIGIRPVCLRYPFGASNQTVRDRIRFFDMIPVPMGFNSFDYNRPGVDKIVDQVMLHINNHANRVLLFHDGYNKREQTIQALPIIIKKLSKKNISFSTICDNSK